MADVATAQAMVTYYSERPPSIRGSNAYVQFSNHEELKTEKTPQVLSVICKFTFICMHSEFLAFEYHIIITKFIVFLLQNRTQLHCRSPS